MRKRDIWRKADRETKQAIRDAVEHWKDIVTRRIKNSNPNNCPLCRLFFDGECEGCPVSQFTGEAYCEETPYWEWANAGESETRGAAAKKELAFLESFVPKKERGVSTTKHAENELKEVTVRLDVLSNTLVVKFTGKLDFVNGVTLSGWEQVGEAVVKKIKEVRGER